MFTKRVHVFKAGSQTSAQGVQRNFSPKDLQQVVDTYDPAVHEAPLVIGHQGDNDSVPSYGWIKGFSREGKDLYADVEFTDAAHDLVKNGHYRKVSISFYSPDSPINPHNGKWSARHLALLGASPPAVKGLEPFTFNEVEGVFEFSTTLSPQDLFDDELGPTLITEISPLEMLKTKLDEVRQELSQESKGGETQPSDPSAETTPEEETTTEEPQNQFSEIAQQTAELEDNLPEEPFMEEGKISRKRVKGAGGQEMQVVEELHKEAEEEDAKEMATSHKEHPAAMKKAPKGKSMPMGEAEEDDDEEEEEEEYNETSDFDEVSYKTAKGGKVSFGKKSVSDDEDDTGRMETARNDIDGYGNRMKVGKATADGETGRLKTAKNGGQEADRMHTAENGEQDADRVNTAKSDEMAEDGENRWAGQADGYDQVHNDDQYDAGKGDYPEPNRPGEAGNGKPAGRSGGPTDVPTETEETPDNTVFAVKTTDVMSDKDMRVLRQKSSDKRAAVKGGAIDHAEGEKKSSHKQLSGEFDRADEAAETVGPDGAYSEGDQKSKKDPYTKTGFGSTYEEGEDTMQSEDADGYAETEDFCGMDNFGMGSMGQARPMGDETVYNELRKLQEQHAELQRRYNEEKMNARKQKIASFVDSLYSEGRLTDGIMPEQELVSYCEGLEFGTLEFAEGETAATRLMGLLAKLPPMVTFGEVVQGGTFQYSEMEDLDPHQQALKMVEKGEAADYVEALKRAMYS